MMDTVLNLGLNEDTLHGLIALTGNERFGWDAYRRFIQMFGRIVMDVNGGRFDLPWKRQDVPWSHAGYRSGCGGLRVADAFRRSSGPTRGALSIRTTS